MAEPNQKFVPPWGFILAFLLAIGMAAFFLVPQSPTQLPEVANQAMAEVPTATPALAGNATTNTLATAVVDALAQRKQLDETVWKDEILAQEHEDTFVKLWDDLRTGSDKFSVLKRFVFREMSAGRFGASTVVQHDVHKRVFKADGSWTRDEFAAVLNTLESSGIEIVQSEWHHRSFEPTNNRSVIAFSIHARNQSQAERHVLAGELEIDWTETKDERGLWQVGRVGFGDLELLSRRGAPAFTEVNLPPLPLADSVGKESILATDLNRDGLPDLSFPQLNLVWRNQGGMRFEPAALVNHLPAGVEMPKVFSGIRAVTGDFTSDGDPDLVLVVPHSGVWLYAGKNGTFPDPPKMAAGIGAELEVPSLVTAGDVDGDGWLDLFVGQYRGIYVNGFMPDHFYDANNSAPSFLLINRQDGSFEDRTVAMGLGKKRNRFCYSASFMDLDGDLDLDLFTVNDFSGVDVFLNVDGHLTDVSVELLDERANFGMGHTLADFDNDARIDLYVTGMSSTTARRLESMGLKRTDYPDITRMRSRMAFGNRMYLGSPDRLRQPPFKNGIARTGWAWGCAAFDFANDGTMDLYVANGHLSSGSCKDYCTRYWTHDVYNKGIGINPVFKAVNESEWEQNSRMSWNGYEKNALLANRGGTNFSNLGFLLDVGFEYDSRGVIAEDFDGDGRVDLAVLESDSRSTKLVHRFHLYRNTWTSNGNWIGARLRPVAGQSVLGAQVKVVTPQRSLVGVLVAGDSYRVQHSATKHFGLGETDNVTRIEVQWPGGRRTIVDSPAINQYHTVSAASGTEAPRPR
jgi:enediyne biosynthesis protein E4